MPTEARGLGRPSSGDTSGCEPSGRTVYALNQQACLQPSGQCLVIFCFNFSRQNPCEQPQQPGTQLCSQCCFSFPSAGVL